MIQSMTAFARQAAQGEWGRATWEIRCVNNRFLEITLKVPEHLRLLESPLREKIKEKIRRGKIECFLKFNTGELANTQYEINLPLVQQLISAAKKLEPLLNDKSTLRTYDVLRWPDVLQASDSNNDIAQQAILNLFDQALAELVQGREREGKELVRLLQDRLEQVASLITIITKQVPTIVADYRQKLLARLAELNMNVDQNRLEQELVIIAQKTDIAEEIDRLNTHIAEVRRQLKQQGAIGRNLDFLMQELNRETNTIGSKCNDVSISKVIVELKVLIDQMREQIQNIE